jgi:hypothetical protein
MGVEVVQGTENFQVTVASKGVLFAANFTQFSQYVCIIFIYTFYAGDGGTVDLNRRFLNGYINIRKDI